MHKQVDPIKATYVTGPVPLKFHELYSPRDNRFRQIHKGNCPLIKTDKTKIENCFLLFKVKNHIGEQKIASSSLSTKTENQNF